MKLKKAKSTLSKSLTIPRQTSNPKPHKLIFYIMAVFCFWNFIFQIISIIDIYSSDSPQSKDNITWPIASICITAFFTTSYYFLYDHRRFIKKKMRRYKVGQEFFDYILITGYICYIISLTTIMVFNENYESARSKFGPLFSFTNIFLLTTFILTLTQKFKIKMIFCSILCIFWVIIFLVNDSRTNLNYEIQTVKNCIRAITDFSLIIIFLYFTRNKPIKKNMEKSLNQINVPVSKISNPSNVLLNKDFEEEDKLNSLLNQIHSAIIIFDEEMNLKYYNKEIYSFLLKSQMKISEPHPANLLEKIPMVLSKNELSQNEILEKLNEITNINLFESNNASINKVWNIF